jgi:C1A family cysteine protease
VKAAHKSGIATEASWPYKIERFAHKPSATADKTGLWHQAKAGYKACLDVDDVLQALSYDIPVVLGYSVFANHDGPQGHIPMPGPQDELLGGHCQWVCAGDPHTREFKLQNSWGTSWGESGYAYLPFAYVERRWASDMWAVLHE